MLCKSFESLIKASICIKFNNLSSISRTTFKRCGIIIALIEHNHIVKEIQEFSGIGHLFWQL